MREYPTFVVAPVQDGRLFLSPAQKKTIAAYLRGREGLNVRLTFSQETKARSNNQNRYYWGVVLMILAAETGHTTEEIHEFCKATFMPKMFITLAGIEQELTKSTTTLSTHDMEEYLETIRAFAATELGIQIPMPHESM